MMSLILIMTRTTMTWMMTNDPSYLTIIDVVCFTIYFYAKINVSKNLKLEISLTSVISGYIQHIRVESFRPIIIATMLKITQ